MTKTEGKAVNPWVKVPFFNKQQQTKYAAVASMAAEIVESRVKLTSSDRLLNKRSAGTREEAYTVYTHHVAQVVSEIKSGCVLSESRQ